MDEQMVSLDTLGSGAAVELFNEELNKVLANILDVNTEAKKKREVKLVVSINPDDSRSFGAVTINASSTLAPVKAHGTGIYIGRKAGRAIATERDQRQMAFDDGNVEPIRKEATGK